MAYKKSEIDDYVKRFERMDDAELKRWVDDWFGKEQPLVPRPDRDAAVAFIQEQFARPSPPGKHGRAHYGLVELRELLDFIYGGPPETPVEALDIETWKQNP